MEPTQENFSHHLNSKFFVLLNDKRAELELTEVKGYRSDHEEQQGMERFSIYFKGVPEFFLPQGLYSLEHEQMGALEIFMVPIKDKEHGILYEAVFNYFKEKSVE